MKDTTMSQLTVREKEHWKERISRKVDQAVDAILADASPGLLDRIAHQARERAVASLGIRDLQVRLDRIGEEEVELLKERQRIYRRMVTQVTGLSEDEQPGSYYSMPREIENAIRKRRELHEKELLGADELGCKVLALRREKEELLDTVWLATSGQQIKQLWQKVADVLRQPPTEFQKEALELDPIDSE